jgi:arylsulfatase A-like enzyme
MLRRRFPLLLSLILFSVGCKREFAPYRLIDHLEERNVIASPLIRIMDEFKKAEQEFKGDDLFPLPPRETRSPTWAIQADSPILGAEEDARPEGMRVLRNGQEIEFREDAAPDQYSWKATQILQTIEPERFPKYAKFKDRNEVVLSRNEYFVSQEIFFPQAEVSFDISAQSQDRAGYSPRLQVYLDEALIQEIRLGPRRIYRFSHRTNRGKGRLRVGFREVDRPGPGGAKEGVVLDRIVLRVDQGLILISGPEKDGRKPEGHFQAVYNTYAGALPFRTFYNTQKKFPLEDMGIGGNPFSIKKKFNVDGATFNGLFAPPTSLFEFELDIPEAGVLEFGCGLLEDAWRLPGDGVSFKVAVIEGRNEDVVFSADIDPLRIMDDRTIFRKQIDLAKYQKKRVKISLATDKKRGLYNDLAYWLNPVIYQKAERKKRAAKTNVILISLDTVRPDHLGCYGYPRETSPTIDRLAEESVLFEKCYSTASSTLMAHMSLLTSLSPARHQVYGETDRLATEVVSLADALRNKDYFCSAFTGSGLVSAHYGFADGFDEYHEDKYSVFQGDAAETLAGRAVQWLKDNRDKPFFLFLHTYQPHSPYFNSSRYNSLFFDDKAKHSSLEIIDYLKNLRSKERAPVPALPAGQDRSLIESHSYRFLPLPDEEKENIIALYDGEIRYTDEYFLKAFLDELKSLGLYEDALLILLSDHGEGFYEHHMWEHGVQLYDELIRVPLLVKFPGSRFKGQRVKGNVSIIDVLPTVLGELGEDSPPGQFEGADLRPLLKHPGEDDRVCYAEVRTVAKIAIIEKSHKFIINQVRGDGLDEAFFIPGPVELYNLTDDPGETKNLADKDKEIAKLFLGHLDLYYQRGREKKPPPGQKQEIPEDLKEVLRSLGYIK